MRKAIIALALKLLGTPYIWGGSSPRFGFDCSGFALWIYQIFGLIPSSIDLTAEGIYHYFRDLGTTDDDLEPGDPVFYGKSASKIVHMMIYLGRMDGEDYVIGASGGDSSTRSESDALKRDAKIKIKPMHYRTDFFTGIHLDMTYAA